MRGPLDWISRVVMLVLAGLVSLSIIGTIAAIPSGSIEGRMGIEDRSASVPDFPPEEQAGTQATERRTAAGDASAAKGQITVSAAPPPTAEEKIEGWLEAITYTLIGLLGIAALATVILWRGVQERRRIADALEARGLPPSS